MKYEYYSNILFIMFWTDIARFLQYFRNLSNSFINIFAILQDFNGIFSKYSFNITVLCGINVTKKIVGNCSLINHINPLTATVAHLLHYENSYF